MAARGLAHSVGVLAVGVVKLNVQIVNNPTTSTRYGTIRQCRQGKELGSLRDAFR